MGTTGTCQILVTAVLMPQLPGGHRGIGTAQPQPQSSDMAQPKLASGLQEASHSQYVSRPFMVSMHMCTGLNGANVKLE
jgi:hypothetical protein